VRYLAIPLVVRLSSSNDITTPPGPQSGSETNVEGGGSSWAVTHLNSEIGLAGFRTRDLSRIMRVLYRRTGGK
jgi:hypothetical protein